VENLWLASFSRRQVAASAETQPVDDGGALDSVAPEFPPMENVHEGIRRVLEGASCCFVIPLYSEDGLNQALPWRAIEGRWGFSTTEYGVYDRPVRQPDRWVSRPFEVSLKAVLQPPREPERGPEREFDTPLPSAGLPSLGKRRP